MCRMLGLASSSPFSPKEFLESFYPLCTKGKVKPSAQPGHLDGWGIAGYPHGKADYFGRSYRNASLDLPAWQNAINQAENKPSKILLAHFRKGTMGDAKLENTHPFIKNGWIFCHNGTIFEPAKLPLTRYTPQGGTDSERFFLFLLEKMESDDPRVGLPSALRYVRENIAYNSLTFLLANGSSLYAYRSYSDKRFEKSETLAERDRYFTLWSAEREGVHLISSEPIQVEKIHNWKALSNDELILI